MVYWLFVVVSGALVFIVGLTELVLRSIVVDVCPADIHLARTILFIILPPSVTTLTSTSTALLAVFHPAISTPAIDRSGVLLLI
jgi:hypothetical protein